MLCCCESVFDGQINWGELGEVFTGLGTLILAGVTVFLYIEARKQLGKVKEFIVKYTSASEKNELLLRVQSAESIIFKQIEFHYKILERIETDEEEVFKKIYYRLGDYYGIPPAPDMQSKISEAYQKLDVEYGYQLRHYFRNLYRIFKYINDISDTEIPDFDKKYYAKLVRAQLSEYELLLLFYNCIWVEDEYKFKKLVIKYGLLEGINLKKFFEEGHSELYSEDEYNAYGGEL